MNRHLHHIGARIRRWTRPSTLAVVLLVLSACGGVAASPAGDTGLPPQTREQGGITLAFAWIEAAPAPILQVTMDTHSVDLDGIDLGQLAELRHGDREVVRPTSWSAPAGGHHRSGTLTFPPLTEEPAPGAPHTYDLRIRALGPVPDWSFTWTR
ncbi:MAG TPA: hypothetical protein VGE07_02245 [Herpetosiphonaceae bacterium]